MDEFFTDQGIADRFLDNRARVSPKKHETAQLQALVVQCDVLFVGFRGSSREGFFCVLKRFSFLFCREDRDSVALPILGLPQKKNALKTPNWNLEIILDVWLDFILVGTH